MDKATGTVSCAVKNFSPNVSGRRVTFLICGGIMVLSSVPMPEEPDRINVKYGLFMTEMIRCAEWRCNDAQKKPENISYK